MVNKPKNKLEEYTENLLKSAIVYNPLKSLSEIFSNLEFMPGDSDAIRQVVEKLDPFIRRRNRRIMYYLRVYTNLLYADSYFERKNPERTKQYLELAYNTELRMKLKEEQEYIRKIKSLIDVARDQLNREQLENIDRDRLRSRIHIAQNVCVMRMLYF